MRSGEELVVVFVTTGSEAEADTVTEAWLEERLVACVNRVSGVRSDYWWQGAREASEECLLIAKTRRVLFPRVLEAVRTAHSYEVFEAIAVPLISPPPPRGTTSRRVRGAWDAISRPTVP